MKFKAILFDMDGTLIKSHPFHVKIYKKIGKELGINPSNKRIKFYLREPSEISFNYFIKDFKIKKSKKWLINKKSQMIKKMAKNKKAIIPGTEKLIKELKKDFKLGIVTGSSKTLMNAFLSKKFKKNFQTIITLNDVKHIKPNPEPINKALKKLKIKPKQAIMVGDSITDIIAGKKAKIKTIGITTGLATRKQLKAKKPLTVISKLKEIKKFVY